MIIFTEGTPFGTPPTQVFLISTPSLEAQLIHSLTHRASLKPRNQIWLLALRKAGDSGSRIPLIIPQQGPQWRVPGVGIRASSLTSGQELV